MSVTFGIPGAFAVFALQALFARIWMRTFLYGPIEWVWRCQTYGCWLPLLP